MLRQNLLFALACLREKSHAFISVIQASRNPSSVNVNNNTVILKHALRTPHCFSDLFWGINERLNTRFGQILAIMCVH